MVDMAKEEIMDWSIPVSCELVPGYTVPPVALRSCYLSSMLEEERGK